MADGWYNEDWWRKIGLPKKPSNYLGDYLKQGVTNAQWDSLTDEEQKSGSYHKSSSGEHIKMQAHKDAVDQKARMAEFQAAQQGAPQRFVSHGQKISPSMYESTSMLPKRGSPKSDPARLQASPVGYDKDEWWRQNPYRSPVQENFSIFSMTPYSW